MFEYGLPDVGLAFNRIQEREIFLQGPESDPGQGAIALAQKVMESSPIASVDVRQSF